MDIARLLQLHDTGMDSLFKLSVDYICCNFATFYHVYTVSKDPRLQGCLLFLRRFCSKYMIQEIRRRSFGILDKKYFDFLLNEHLTTLEMSHYSDRSAVVERLKVMGHAVLKAEFTQPYSRCSSDSTGEIMQNSPKPFMEEALPCLPNLKVLYLDQKYYWDERTLELLFNTCKNLTELHMLSCYINSEGLMKVCSTCEREVSKLEKLHIDSSNNLDDAMVFLLENFPHLDVDFNGIHRALYRMHKDEYTRGGLSGLRHYGITSMRFSTSCTLLSEPAITIAAAVCPRVTELTVEGMLTEEIFTAASLFQQLKSIHLSNYCGSDFMPICVDEFLRKTRSAKIESMRLDTVALSMSDLIRNFVHLKELVLCRVRFTTSSRVLETECLEKLSILSLMHMSFTDSTTVTSLEVLLSRAPLLRTIKFAGYQLEMDVEIDHLIRIFEGKSLPLRNVIFISPVWKRLTKFFIQSQVSLRKIDLGVCTNMTLADIKWLREFAHEANYCVKIVCNRVQVMFVMPQ